MSRRQSSWVCIFLLVFLSGVVLWGVRGGSLHNSDDVLYAQVMRQVSEGSWFPLKFFDNSYTAKPPLAFWVGGALVSLAGDHEASFRLLGALSFLLLLGMGAWLMFREEGAKGAILLLLLLFGCSLLTLHSRRVMLDLPVTALAMAMVLTFLRRKHLRWMFFWGLALAGWWTKELLILPPLGAVLAYLVLENRDVFRGKSFWIYGLGFILGVGLLSGMSENSTWFNASSMNAVKANVLPLNSSQDLYLQVLWADTFWIWLVPLALVWVAFAWRALPAAPKVFALAFLFQAVSVYFTKTQLPHYVLPNYFYGLVLVAFFLTFLGRKLKQGRRIFWVGLLLLAILQAFVANQFRWKANDPDFDPSAATKRLALQTRTMLPESTSLCVVDTYFVGFSFYGRRPTRGIYLSSSAFEALHRVKEFQGMVVKGARSTLLDEIRNTCDGWFIAPERWVEVYPNQVRVHSREGSLVLAQFFR